LREGRRSAEKNEKNREAKQTTRILHRSSASLAAALAEAGARM
jgi:mevalonate pyrophosphate decarboxylase